jgi:DNA-binding response OmpR family regulator
VAENVLRQQGYEVISVSTGDKALEVLELSKPNLILVDSTIATKGKKLLFDRIQEDMQTSSIPFLLIADEDDKSLDYPDEVVLTRPIDPKELVLKVSALSGAAGAKKSGQNNPLDDSLLEEDLLDQALGLDQIDVTDSEIMDRPPAVKKKGGKGVEKMIGMEHDHDAEEDSQKTKVESLRLESEEMEGSGQKPKDSAKTGKLEILSDHEQFALGDESLLERSGEFGTHDYEWFIKEMKKDVASKPEQPKSAKATASTAAQPTPARRKTDSGKVKGEAGVEKFIEDFKKEVEKFADPPSTPAKVTRTAVHKATATAAPQRRASDIGSVTIDQVEVFTRQFVDALAEKVAEKIATKIDAQKLLSLIKNEIVSKNQKH